MGWPDNTESEITSRKKLVDFPSQPVPYKQPVDLIEFLSLIYRFLFLAVFLFYKSSVSYTYISCPQSYPNPQMAKKEIIASFKNFGFG